jgi:signal transduction histidine kinase
MRSARLVALLDFVERPAAVLSPGGALLGANARFAALADEIGLPDVSEFVSLLGAAERAPLTDRFSSVATGAQQGGERAVRFIDGVCRRVRVECHGEPGEEPMLLAVIDARAADSVPRTRASLGHDLAGPLTAILGTAELLLIRGADLPEGVRQSLGNILQNCGRITEILAREREARARRDDGAGSDG